MSWLNHLRPVLKAHSGCNHADGAERLWALLTKIRIRKPLRLIINRRHERFDVCQAMLKETLNIECNLRTVVDSVWFDDARNGNFDLAIGAIVSTLLDPFDYFNAWYGKGSPQN